MFLEMILFLECVFISCEKLNSFPQKLVGWGSICLEIFIKLSVFLAIVINCKIYPYSLAIFFSLCT